MECHSAFFFKFFLGHASDWRESLCVSTGSEDENFKVNSIPQIRKWQEFRVSWHLNTAIDKKNHPGYCSKYNFEICF